MTADEAGKGRLGWSRLAIFSLPILLIQAIEIPWRTYLPAFLTGPLGFGLAAAGTLLAAIRLFDTGFDLFVGWASDRWPTRFGRRKPWMAAGVPLIMAGSAGVFLAPPGVPLGMLAVWAVLLHAGYTMVVTPHGGWGLEVGRTPRERLRVIAVKTWFGALAMPLVVFLPSLLERTIAADRTMQMRTMGAAILLLAPIIIAWVLRVIPEPETAPQPHVPQRRRMLDGVKELLRHPDFARIASLYALAGLTEATGSGSFIFFVEGPLGLDGWASTLLLAQALIALTSLPIWAWIGDRIGKSRALTIALAVQACAMALMLIVPPGAAALGLALLAVRYACWGVDFLFLRAMVADLAGGALDAGHNSSATHYSAFNVTLRIAFSLGAGLVLWIPALLGAAPGSGAPFDDAVRLVFTVPACLGAICSLLLLARAGTNRLQRYPSGIAPLD